MGSEKDDPPSLRLDDIGDGGDGFGGLITGMTFVTGCRSVDPSSHCNLREKKDSSSKSSTLQVKLCFADARIIQA
jgi:hypothetical protein